MSKFEIKDGVLVRYNAPFPLKEKEDYTLVIPEGVKEIKEYVFEMSNFKKLILPKSLKTIGDSAFQYSSIKEIEGGEMVEKIGIAAFEQSQITKLENFKNLRIIEKRAFSENKIVHVKFSNKLEFIGESAFAWNNIKELDMGNVEKVIIRFDAFMGNSIEKFTPMQNGIAFNGAFSYNYLNGEDYMNRNINLYTLKTFLNSYNTLPKVIIPVRSDIWNKEDFKMDEDTIISLSKKGRLKLENNCDLTILHFEGLKNIGKDFLKKLPAIQNIYIEDGYEKIDAEAFSEADISYIRLPETLKSIGDSAFKGSYLKGVKIPKSVKSIEKEAFSDSQIEYLDMEDSKVKVIKSKMCEECHSLKFVKLPLKLTNISELAFIKCNSLKEIELPGSLKKIGYRAFDSSGLVRVRLEKENSIEKIEDSAFSCCHKLTDMNFEDLKSSVELDRYAFYKTNLKSVVINENVFISLGVFEKSSLEEAKIYASFIGEKAFKNARIKKLTLSGDSMTIKESAFLNNDIESLEVKCKSLKLDKEVFRNNNIKSVKIENLEKIYDSTFWGNPIEELEIPEQAEVVRSEGD